VCGDDRGESVEFVLLAGVTDGWGYRVVGDAEQVVGLLAQ
jgi:hypothetical protein